MMLSTSNLTAFTATKNALTPGVSILFLIQKIKRLLASKTLENIMSKIFECVLQGEVREKDQQALIQRVTGLVGQEPESFAFREFVYERQIVPQNGKKCLRAREIVDGKSVVIGPPIPGTPSWELHYVGAWERKASARAGEVTVPFRSIVAGPVSSNVREFLHLAGFRPKYRYVRGGWRWTFPSGIYVECTHMAESENSKDAKFVTDMKNYKGEWLLELRATTVAEHIEDITEKIRRLACDLDPYFIERLYDTKAVSISTATLAAESRKKRPRAS